MKSPALQAVEDFGYELLALYDPEFSDSDLAYDWREYAESDLARRVVGDPFRDLVVKYWEQVEGIEY